MTPYYSDGMATLYCGDALAVLRTLPDGIARTCVTSPPYYGLRDYGTATWESGDPECDHVAMAVGMSGTNTLGPTGHLPSTNSANVGRLLQYRATCGKCGARRIDQQIGLEESPDAYVARLVEVFREVRRVLTPDGTAWINLGDSYANDGKWGGRTGGKHVTALHDAPIGRTRRTTGLKPKDLIGVPWMVAFALRADGWWLRSDVIWCLSGGTRVYARTQKGEMPMTIKDLVRLRPETVQLWNGTQWTQALGWSRADSREGGIEIELRSGERIGCTPHHRWPTQRGEVAASDLAIGDVIATTTLPERGWPSPAYLPDEEIGAFIGLYLAEGSRSGATIQISGHIREAEPRAEFLRRLASAYGGTVSVGRPIGNGVDVRVESRVLSALIDQYIVGRTARDKHLTTAAWQRSNQFLRHLAEAYLMADGHMDAANHRWRIGFTCNDSWATDLRTMAARLGATVRLRRTVHQMGERRFPGWRGEWRWAQSDHHNTKPNGEIVAIRRSRARKFWHIGVADAPHQFALASGVLTCNSKPNPMPESVTDRPTKAHEYVFLLAKAERYYYDADAIREPNVDPMRVNYTPGRGRNESAEFARASGDNHRGFSNTVGANGRNRRTVWTINSQPFPASHFAVMPPKLVEPCILAGSAPGDTVLDPFLGSGTVAMMANRLGRKALGIDLNPDYLAMAKRRIAQKGFTFEEAAS